MSFKNVLVTGGAGFIGCALSQILTPESESWVVMDSMHAQVHQSADRPKALHPAARWINADVTRSEDWDRVLEETAPDLVIHLAAETGTAQSLNEATRHANVNVVGTTEMMDAFGRKGILPKHIILTSSRAVYGEGNWQKSTGAIYQPGIRSHEMLASGVWDFSDSIPLPSSAMTTVPAPTSVYGATKLAQENLLGAWGQSRGVGISVLRLQNVFGAGQSLSNPYTGIVSLFSQLAMKGEPIPLYEDGNIVRDFIYIDDVVSAISRVAKAGAQHSQPILDIGSGRGSTILELAQLISNYHGSPEPYITGKFRDGDVRFATGDISVSREVISWNPQVELSAGLASLQEWIAGELSDSEGGDFD